MSGLRDAYLKVFVTRGTGYPLMDAPCERPTIIVAVQEISEIVAKGQKKGIKAKTVSIRKIPPVCLDPRIKALPYLNHILARNEAKEAGARIIATGRSDFPNQINNSLGFPGIFRGTLEVRASTITDSMCITAAESIAQVAEEKGLHEEYIIPPMENMDVFIREATAIALKAMDEGVARIKRSKNDIYEHSKAIIERSHNETAFLMKEGFIRPPPEV